MGGRGEGTNSPGLKALVTLMGDDSFGFSLGNDRNDKGVIMLLAAHGDCGDEDMWAWAQAAQAWCGSGAHDVGTSWVLVASKA